MDAADEISITDLADGVDVFFLLVCTVLILMMQAGFALYEVCVHAYLAHAVSKYIL